MTCIPQWSILRSVLLHAPLPLHDEGGKSARYCFFLVVSPSALRQLLPSEPFFFMCLLGGTACTVPDTGHVDVGQKAKGATWTGTEATHPSTTGGSPQSAGPYPATWVFGWPGRVSHNPGMRPVSQKGSGFNACGMRVLSVSLCLASSSQGGFFFGGGGFRADGASPARDAPCRGKSALCSRQMCPGVIFDVTDSQLSMTTLPSGKPSRPSSRKAVVYVLPCAPCTGGSGNGFACASPVPALCSVFLGFQCR